MLTIDGAGRREVCTTPRGVVVGPDLAAYGGTGRPWNEIVVDPRGRVFVNMPGSMGCRSRSTGCPTAWR
ncbi:hypothetical protein [Nocardioides ochotonae]|uniref:hypothetical protein n=1 Tax=Nocardioides ochotonae TaxID=2685869 RepID=UPI00140E25D4|nr:hypothetical protein [Nocardioides ochotonae]